jgi:hypothetical protein
VSCVNLLKLECCWEVGSWEVGEEGGEEAIGVFEEMSKLLLLLRIGFDLDLGGASEVDGGEASIVVDGLNFRGLREVF